MKLSQDQADVLEEFIASDGWLLVIGIYNERIQNRERQLRSGRLDHDEYLRVCESIREAEYLRDRPIQLIREARMEVR